LYESAAPSEAIEAGPHNSFLLFWRKPFDGQAGDHTAQLHCADCGVLPQSRGVAFDDGHAGQFLAEDSGKVGLAFESDDSLGWAAGPNQSTGKAPGSCPQFEHRPRSRKVYLSGHRVSESSTARIGRGNAPRLLHPQSKEHAGFGSHALPPHNFFSRLF
jgi:hypothetical protein